MFFGPEKFYIINRYAIKWNPLYPTHDWLHNLTLWLWPLTPDLNQHGQITSICSACGVLVNNSKWLFFMSSVFQDIRDKIVSETLSKIYPSDFELIHVARVTKGILASFYILYDQPVVDPDIWLERFPRLQGQGFLNRQSGIPNSQFCQNTLFVKTPWTHPTLDLPPEYILHLSDWIYQFQQISVHTEWLRERYATHL